jgi:hypothetical protein
MLVTRKKAVGADDEVRNYRKRVVALSIGGGIAAVAIISRREHGCNKAAVSAPRPWLSLKGPRLAAEYGPALLIPVSRSVRDWSQHDWCSTVPK